MRRIVVFNMVSLDGYFAGPDGDISWHNVDSEFNEFAIKQTPSFGALIFGRKTYELMAGYWPTKQAIKNDPVVAGIMNTIPKIVFSRSLKRVQETDTWKNVRLMKRLNVDELKELKLRSVADIAVFGSGEIVQQLTNLGLVDEFRLMINPVILGKGKLLFANIKNRFMLEFLKLRTFKNGNILLTYNLNHDKN